jgi:hypothetical protein
LWQKPGKRPPVFRPFLRGTVKKIKLEKGWDPDKYRDDLCRRRWKESGAKNLDEFQQWRREQERKLKEAVEASGMGYLEYLIAERKAATQANA